MNTALFLLLAGVVLVNVRPLRTRILPFTPMVWTRDSVDLREGKGSGPGIADPALMLELIAVMFLAGSTMSGALRQLLSVLAPAFQPILVRVSAGLEMGAAGEKSGRRPPATECQRSFPHLNIPSDSSRRPGPLRRAC